MAGTLPLAGAAVRLRIMPDKRLTFFDDAQVMAAVAKKERQALSKFGAFVRTRSRSSLRYIGKRAAARNEVSAPGKPPFLHRSKSGGDSPLKALLFFAYDHAEKSVVIGPAVFPSRAKSQPTGGTIPGTLEKGGTVTVVKRIPVKSGARQASPRQKEAFLRKVKDGSITVQRKFTEKRESKNYAARPFMAPALKAEIPNFLPLFGGGLTAGGG